MVNMNTRKQSHVASSNSEAIKNSLVISLGDVLELEASRGEKDIDEGKIKT